MRLFTRLLMVCAASLMVAPAFASAATRGTFTSTEYQQLALLQSKLKTASKSSVRALEHDEAFCRATPTSGFLRLELTDCRDLFVWLASTVGIDPVAARCKRDSSMDARFNCLRPAYERVARTTEALYRAELALTRAAKNRGFSRDCLLAVSDTSKTVAAERRMAADAAKIVSGLRSHDPITVEKFAGQFEVDAADADGASKNYPLTVCPHE